MEENTEDNIQIGVNSQENVLSNEDLQSSNRFQIRYSVGTDVGKKRSENQDSYGVLKDDNFHLFIVADGMGGAKGGAYASSLAINVLEREISSGNNPEELDPDKLVRAIKKANTEIYKKGSTESHLEGMGTTFVSIAFLNEKILIANVGDSRIYRIRDLQIEQLTNDHTLVQELVRSGSISQDQAEDHPVSHMLTRSLGPAAEVEVDCEYHKQSVKNGDRYLVCSDGLYNMVPLPIIQDIIGKFNLDDAIQNLIDYANSQGGNDNITAILIEVKEVAVSNVTLNNERISKNNQIQREGYNERLLTKDQQDIYKGTFLKPKKHLEVKYLVIGLIVFATGALFNPNVFRSFKVFDSDTATVRKVVNGNILKKTDSKSADFETKNQIIQENTKIHETIEYKANSEDSLALNVDTPPIVDVYEPSLVIPIFINQNSSIALNNGEHNVVNKNPDNKDRLDAEKSLDELIQDNNSREVKLKKVLEIERRMNLLDAPIGGEIAKISSDAKAELLKVEDELNEVEKSLDFATRRLTVWFSRAKDIDKSDPLTLLNEVALTSNRVRELKVNYEKATWEYLKISEELKINPRDAKLNESLKDLSKTRNDIKRNLSNDIREAIKLEIDASEQEITSISTRKGELEKHKEENEQLILFAKAILSGDSELKKKIKADLAHQKDSIMIELGLQ